jgi:SpoVK/Ycf46/Vps4 family AAA+-type ATPase
VQQEDDWLSELGRNSLFPPESNRRDSKARPPIREGCI